VLSERATVVLLHSSAGSARQWDALAQALAPRAEVHAIDLHGHGARADWPASQAMSLADEAALALPILERSSAVHLVGHSYGAAVALKLATLQPDRVRSVSVFEPVLFRLLLDHQGGTRTARDVIEVAQVIDERVAIGHHASAARRFVDFWGGAGAWARLSARAQASTAARMRSVARHFHALFDESALQARLSALAPKMLCLTGGQTVAATRHIGALLRWMLPGAQHEVLPGMGHMGPVTHAAHVNRCLLDFLHHQGVSSAA
jgi:pimeloyl-ACP methyl ester carboxylesterase